MGNELLQKIEYTRAKMIQSGMANGFRHAHTIRLSEKVDALLNLYYAQAQPATKSATSKN